jgi:hypothetical protein
VSSFGQRWLAAIPTAIAIALVTWYQAAGGGLFRVGDAQDREGYIDRTGHVIWKPTK